jgi:hypothetical protein
MFITLADFIGKYEVHTGMYDSANIQSYIDKYEERYLRQLLGVDLCNEFMSDINPTTLEPKSPNFQTIFFPLYEDVTLYQTIESEGIISMLTGFIYFEYTKDLLMQQTTYGGVQQKAENSSVLNTLQTQIYDRYNESVKTFNAIRLWIYLNMSTPTGQAVEFAYMGGTGSGYSTVLNYPLTPLSGSVMNTQLLNAGTGYTTGNNIGVTGGSGTGLTLNIVANAGVIQSVTINNRGTNYTQNNIVTITGGGVNATVRLNTVTKISHGTTLVADVEAYLIGGVNTTGTLVGGTGYNTFVNVPCTGGSGTGCLIDIMDVSPTGAILDFQIDSTGFGYTVGNVLTITGGTTPATFVVTSVFNGEVKSIDWVDAGINWEVGDVFLVAGGNNNCFIQLIYVGKGDLTEYNGREKLFAYWI